MPEEVVEEILVEAARPELQERLLDFLMTTLTESKEAIIAGTEVVVDELPKFAHDYVMWGITGNLVDAFYWSIPCVVCIVLFYKAFKWFKSMVGENPDDKDIGFAVVSMVISGAFLTIFAAVVTNRVKHAAQAYYAPRAYLVDKLLVETRHRGLK